MAYETEALMKETQTMMQDIKKLEKVHGADLSMEEDLSIGLMNLISIEEHLYFTGIKTGKEEFFSMMNSVREMRKRLMQGIVAEPEGEVWCISKHLLAATMRLIEVGSKLQSRDKGMAQERFNDAFELYSLFWRLNLKSGVKHNGERQLDAAQGRKLSTSWLEFLKKALDCCKE